MGEERNLRYSIQFAFHFLPPPLKLNSEDHHDKLLRFQRWEDAGGDLKEASAFLRLPASPPRPRREGNERLVWNLNPAWKNFLGQVHRSVFQERDGFYSPRTLKGERGKKTQESDSTRAHVQARMPTTAEGTSGTAGRTASKCLKLARSAA